MRTCIGWRRARDMAVPAAPASLRSFYAPSVPDTYNLRLRIQWDPVTGAEEYETEYRPYGTAKWIAVVAEAATRDAAFYVQRYWPETYADMRRGNQWPESHRARLDPPNRHAVAVRVRAVNADGYGPWREESLDCLGYALRPTESTFAATSSALSFTLAAQADPPAPLTVTSLEVRYRKEGATQWTRDASITAQSGARPTYVVTLSGLEAATQYEIAWRLLYPAADGSVSWDDWSVSFALGTTALPSVPAQPTGLRMTDRTYDVMYIAWDRRQGASAWRLAVRSNGETGDGDETVVYYEPSATLVWGGGFQSRPGWEFRVREGASGSPWSEWSEAYKPYDIGVMSGSLAKVDERTVRLTVLAYALPQGLAQVGLRVRRLGPRFDTILEPGVFTRDFTNLDPGQSYFAVMIPIVYGSRTRVRRLGPRASTNAVTLDAVGTYADYLALRVSWLASLTAESRVQVQYRRSGDADWTDDAVVASNAIRHTIEGLPPGAYDVRLRSVSDADPPAYVTLRTDANVEVPSPSLPPDEPATATQYNRLRTAFLRHRHADLSHDDLVDANSAQAWEFSHEEAERMLSHLSGSGFSGFTHFKLGYTTWRAGENRSRHGEARTLWHAWLEKSNLRFRGLVQNRLQRAPYANTLFKNFPARGGDGAQTAGTGPLSENSLGNLDVWLELLKWNPESSEADRERSASAIPDALGPNNLDTLSLDWWGWIDFAQDAFLSWPASKQGQPFAQNEISATLGPCVLVQHANIWPGVEPRAHTLFSDEQSEAQQALYGTDKDFFVADRGPLFALKYPPGRSLPETQDSTRTNIRRRADSDPSLLDIVRRGIIVVNLHAGVFQRYAAVAGAARSQQCLSLPGFYWMAWI